MIHRHYFAEAKNMNHEPQSEVGVYSCTLNRMCRVGIVILLSRGSR